MSSEAVQGAFFGGFLLLVWIAVEAITARVDGWPELASDYRCHERFVGTKFRFVRARMRWSRPLLVVGSSTEGLYLAGALLGRVGRPPVLIPWRDVRRGRDHSTYRRLWNLDDVDDCFFELGRERARLGLSVVVACTVIEVAGLAWPMREGHAAQAKEKARQS